MAKMPKNLDLTDNLEQYIINYSDDLTTVQKEIIAYNHSLGDEQRLQISISQAQFLQSIVKAAKVKKILEIGSFTGFSALSMALALPKDGSLISLDKNVTTANVAKSFYDQAKEKRIKQIIKPALESLKELEKNKEIFDLIFIDADKDNYANYYDSAINMINAGGLIIIDNVLWHGEVADKNNNDKFTNIIRDFNEHVKKDQRITKNIIPVGDGLTVCIKK
jgi:caffeoyl-CoA O-methyltransferase